MSDPKYVENQIENKTLQSKDSQKQLLTLDPDTQSMDFNMMKKKSSKDLLKQAEEVIAEDKNEDNKQASDDNKNGNPLVDIQDQQAALNASQEYLNLTSEYSD